MIISILYTACVMLATIANQRGSDPEAVILGQLVLTLPWDLVLAVLGVSLNSSYGPYIYGLCIALNAGTLYGIMSWIATRKRSK